MNRRKLLSTRLIGGSGPKAEVIRRGNGVRKMEEYFVMDPPKYAMFLELNWQKEFSIG